MPRDIYFLERRAGKWTRTMTEYEGSVVAVADDETATYLLFKGHADTALYVMRRTHSGVDYPPRLLSDSGAYDGAITARDGRWWAVWSDSKPDNTMKLWQAGTLLGTRDAHPISTPALGDSYIHLGNGPRGRLVLVWQRELSELREGRRVATIRVASTSDGRWSSRQLSARGVSATAPSMTADAKGVAVAWSEGARGGLVRLVRLRADGSTWMRTWKMDWPAARLGGSSISPVLGVPYGGDSQQPYHALLRPKGSGWVRHDVTVPWPGPEENRSEGGMIYTEPIYFAHVLVRGAAITVIYLHSRSEDSGPEYGKDTSRFLSRSGRWS
ncbi:MAG TPA: hypothetical protein VNA30_02750 [Mycobacteriales bacterium]|nr:hypothetical protein [Mycobacteriales bacterium]